MIMKVMSAYESVFEYPGVYIHVNSKKCFILHIIIIASQSLQQIEVWDTASHHLRHMLLLSDSLANTALSRLSICDEGRRLGLKA